MVGCVKDDTSKAVECSGIDIVELPVTSQNLAYELHALHLARMP